MGQFVDYIKPGTVVLCDALGNGMPKSFGLIIPSQYWQQSVSPFAQERFRAANDTRGYVALARCHRHPTRSFSWHVQFYSVALVSVIKPEVSIFDSSSHFESFVKEVTLLEDEFEDGYCRYFLATFKLMRQYLEGTGKKLTHPELRRFVSAIGQSRT